MIRFVNDGVCNISVCAFPPILLWNESCVIIRVFHKLDEFRGSCEAWVLSPLGVTFYHWIVLFSHSEGSDANIGTRL